MNVKDLKSQFDYWFGTPEVLEEKKQVDTKQKCPDCKKAMSACSCNHMKADKKDAKDKKGKNKMGTDVAAPATAAAPASTAPAPKPMAMKADKKKGKKALKEGTGAKVVWGVREGKEVVRKFSEKKDVASALASAKRMVNTKDLGNVTFIDVVDLKEGLTRTIFETFENYKSRKRLFETHVACAKCGNPELELSIKKTKIRCKRCGEEDLVENVDGVEKSLDVKPEAK